MGAGLVKRVFAYAAEVPLNPNEHKLLTFMSLTALDADQPPRYFDSREASALALGRRVSDDPTDPDRISAFEAVKVATRGLVDLGAIERAVSGRRGHRAEFVIRLDPARSRTTPEFAKRKARPSPTRKGQPSPKRKPALPRSESAPFPPGTNHENQEQNRGINSTNETTSPAPVDNESQTA